MVIGTRLRFLREEKGLSQGDIEKTTGLLRCYISRIENGHTIPSLETLQRFAGALDVPMYKLFFSGEGEPPTPNLMRRKGIEELAEQPGKAGEEARFMLQFKVPSALRRIAAQLGEELGMSPAKRSDLYLTGLLHDVGKIGVDDQVLKKNGPLTPEEFRQIQAHVEIGVTILKDLKKLNHILPGVKHHHESLDGTGYPDRLAGDDIPLEARILAVADAYDAMSSNRPYRKRLSLCKDRQDPPGRTQHTMGPRRRRCPVRLSKRRRGDPPKRTGRKPDRRGQCHARSQLNRRTPIRSDLALPLLHLAVVGRLHEDRVDLLHECAVFVTLYRSRSGRDFGYNPVGAAAQPPNINGTRPPPLPYSYRPAEHSAAGAARSA